MTDATHLGGEPHRFYGKYRGRVLDNVDPMGLARILAEVAAVPGMLLNWALPCVPYAGPGVGFLALPPIGASVWVEFEGGDPAFPIWTGCFWQQGEFPFESAIPERKIWRTEAISLELDDRPGEGGLRIQVQTPAVQTPILLSFDAEGVRLSVAETALRLTPESLQMIVPESLIELTGETVTIMAPTVVVEGDLVRPDDD